MQWTEDRISMFVEGSRRYERGRLAANIDGWIPGDSNNDPTIVECKSTSLTDDWGEPGTDEVPDYVICQTQFAMNLANVPLAYVPVLFTGWGAKVRLYEVPYNEDLAEAIISRCELFWDNHVEPRVPPPGQADYDVVKSIIRERGKTVTVDDDLVHRWQRAKQAKSDATALEKEAKAALLAAMEDADAGECSFGTVVYPEIKRKGYTVKATTYRRLGFTEATE